MKKVIQIILLAFAVGSFYKCNEIALQDEVGFTRQGQMMTSPKISTPITSGYNGGALGMGIICAASLLGIALIEKDN